MGEKWIWISKWETFQHYPPERDRAPAWIKTYSKQLDDDTYRALTMDQRGLLHELRIAFARAHGRLSMNTGWLAHRLGCRVLTPQVKRLSDAGFLELVSRATLERRLEAFYASRARAEKLEGEREKERAVRAVRGSKDPARATLNGQSPNSPASKLEHPTPKPEAR